MNVFRFVVPCLIIGIVTSGVLPAANAAILYQFTTADSTTAPNDDGFVAADVVIAVAPGVIGPVDGTALALGKTGLNRIWNSEFAGFSLSSTNGNAIDNATEFNTGFFTWTVSATPGNLLNLTSLNFGSGVGGSGTRGFEIYAEVNGGAFEFGDLPILAIAAETGTRGNPVARSADLNGAAFQNIESITFRYYPLTPATGNSIDFTGMTLNGDVAAIPEPGSFMLLGVGIAGGLWWHKRSLKVVRACG